MSGGQTRHCRVTPNAWNGHWDDLAVFSAKLAQWKLGDECAVPLHLRRLANHLHGNLGLLFIPAGVGVPANINLVQRDGLAVIVVVVGSRYSGLQEAAGLLALLHVAAALHPICRRFNHVPDAAFNDLVDVPTRIIVGDANDYDGGGDACKQLTWGMGGSLRTREGSQRCPAGRDARSRDR